MPGSLPRAGPPTAARPHGLRIARPTSRPRAGTPRAVGAIAPRPVEPHPGAAAGFARTHSAVCHEPHSLVIALANGTPIAHTDSEFHGPTFQMFAGIGLSDWLPESDSTPVAQRTMLDQVYDGLMNNDSASRR